MMNMQHNDGGFWPEDVKVGEVVYPPGGGLGPRLQANLQLVLIHSGNMTIWIDQVPHCVQSNEICVLFPGHDERFAFADESETWHSWVHAFVPHLPLDLSTRLQALPWPLPLSPAMNQLIRDGLAMQATTFPTATALLKALAVQMLWRYIGEGEQRRAYATLAIHPAVEQAQYYIHAHLGEPLTLATLASVVATSPSHLIRLFQAQLHTTPMAYLWQRRIAKGIELLEQTGLPVGTIAEQCGFQSRFHFSRRIRETVGYTPLEVRQRSWQR